MREIKFRGVNIHTGKWIYGGFFYSTTLERPFISYDIINMIEVIPETVGQYTGLKDRNGTEIYEGDKVGMCKRGNEWVIEWGYFGDAGFYAHNQINSGRTLDVSDYEDHAVVEITPDEILTCEVIGNIHDKGNA